MDLRSWGNRVRDESGQTAVEYAIVVATTVIILALFLSLMPADVFDSLWSRITSMLP